MSEFTLADTEHYRKSYLIPRTIQPIVCMCSDPGPPLFDYSSRPGPKMNCCKTCRKPYRWYVRICTACREYYVRDFRRVSSCIKHQKCIDCYNKTNRCGCSSTWSEGGLCDFGPLGLNPRIYTAEETAGVFDSGGPF